MAEVRNSSNFLLSEFMFSFVQYGEKWSDSVYGRIVLSSKFRNGWRVPLANTRRKNILNNGSKNVLHKCVVFF